MTPRARKPSLAASLAMILTACLALLSVWSGSFAQASDSADRTPSGQVKKTLPADCHQKKKADDAVCFAVGWTDVETTSLSARSAGSDGPPTTALSPTDVIDAYKLPTATAGGGQTVAIVDAYGWADAEAELSAYRAYYGLPPCTTANGCFKKVDQRGGSDYPRDDAGWGLETMLDLDAVSAACPNCNILLVQGDDAGVDSLTEAVETAVRLGAKVVSNSYGAGEFAEQTTFDPSYDHPGVAVIAASGDVGNQTSWPATIPLVIAAGGTALRHEATTARGWTETAWKDGGSGCSRYEPRPDYQLGLETACPDNRANADLAAVADPATGLAVFYNDGWLQVGGTSLASPLLAGMFALAGTPAAETYPVKNLYSPTRGGNFFDVVNGSNGSCGNILCTAGPGWDGPTGVGTPNGIAGLKQGPHGTITGVVTDEKTGQPIEGAVVSASGGMKTRTDPKGHYSLANIDVGTYDISASAYRYPAESVTGVAVTDQSTTTADFALNAVPSATVSGVVSDGSGQGWPLYAEIVIDGYPYGPIFTDPVTGRYSVDLPQSANYTFRVSPIYQGYAPVSRTVTVGSSGNGNDFSLSADREACTAPGYGWNGSSTTFSGWTSAMPQDGWQISGTGGSWRFDNPINRQQPIGSEDSFAIADPAAYQKGRVSTTLTSPAIDLSGQASPLLTLGMRYLGAKKQTGQIQYTLDGRIWTTVWSGTESNAIGALSFPLPQAAHKNPVKVRFTFTGSGTTYWAFDNLFIGTHECAARPGGLVVGDVRDATSGHPLPGAQMSMQSAPGSVVEAYEIVDDPTRTGAFYWLFGAAGSQRITSVKDGYGSTNADVSVVPHSVVRHDFTLSAK